MRDEQSLRQSTISTLVVMGTTFLSRILGFLRVAVIGAIFGGSGEADVINLVFNIPNNLRKLLAEGALSSAFIPVLSGTLVRESGADRARLVVRNILTMQAVILLPLLLLLTLFAGPVVNTILAFPDPGKQALSVELFRYLVHYLLPISVAAVIMGTLNAHSRFFLPAVTPVLFSVSVIGSIVLLHSRLGVFSMAVGVLLGGLLQVLMQIPQFLSLGYTFLPQLDPKNREFRRILKQWLPVVGAASIFAVNQQVAVFFASGLEDGSGSAMTNALTFWQLPFGIFSASITTVLFPRMSRQWNRDDVAGLRSSVRYGLLYLFTLLLPAAVTLALLGPEIIAVALQRGAFEEQWTLLASEVLIGYSFGLFSVGAFTFLQRFFYACDDYKTPLWVAGVAVVLDITLSLYLKETRLRVVGLAVANSVAFTVALLLMVAAARRRLGYLGLRELLAKGWRIIAGTLPLAATLAGHRLLFGDWWRSGSSLVNLGRLALIGVPALGILLISYYLLSVDVVHMVRKKRLDEGGSS
ncbi:MAG: murein biosynthesis integral membrane protein MurJ [Alkalispirochaetaceae bacterium]